MCILLWNLYVLLIQNFVKAYLRYMLHKLYQKNVWWMSIWWYLNFRVSMLLVLKIASYCETSFLWEDMLNLYFVHDVLNRDAIIFLLIRGSPELLNFKIISNWSLQMRTLLLALMNLIVMFVIDDILCW